MSQMALKTEGGIKVLIEHSNIPRSRYVVTPSSKTNSCSAGMILSTFAFQFSSASAASCNHKHLSEDIQCILTFD